MYLNKLSILGKFIFKSHVFVLCKENKERSNVQDCIVFLFLALTRSSGSPSVSVCTCVFLSVCDFFEFLPLSSL